MAPRRATDKGKAPMVETDSEPIRPATRSRGVGIVIGEATEEPERRLRERSRVRSREERQAGEEVEMVTEPATQEVPIVERAQVEPEGVAKEMPGASTAQPEVVVGGHEAAGPSMTTGAVAQPQLIDVMQMMMGALHDMRQDMRHFMEMRSQPHTSTDAVPSPVTGVRGPVLA